MRWWRHPPGQRLRRGESSCRAGPPWAPGASPPRQHHLHPRQKSAGPPQPCSTPLATTPSSGPLPAATSKSHAGCCKGWFTVLAEVNGTDHRHQKLPAACTALHLLILIARMAASAVCSRLDPVCLHADERRKPSPRSATLCPVACWMTRPHSPSLPSVQHCKLVCVATC